MRKLIIALSLCLFLLLASHSYANENHITQTAPPENYFTQAEPENYFTQ